MAINLTDSLNAATTKGKLGDAKQVYLNGDTKNLQQTYEETNTHFDTLDNRSTQMEKAIQDISVTGGASTANAVSYNNSTSKLEAVTAQGAIDELANKKLNKENIAQEFGDSKDKVVSQFAIPFREIESPEFIKAIVDAEDHFLFGIQLDGSIEWGKGIPAPIRAKLQEIITQCQQDKTDLLGSINTINDILDKTTIKDEAGEIQDTPFRVIENEEFIMAVVDSEDRVLFGIYRATGKPYYPQNDMYHISQSEEFLWVILDAANHPLLGIQKDGTCWAAKAQWLDDIKAIKEALSSIDETLKTFQHKEDGKGLINLDVADSFFYISNDEYIIAVVDADGKVLGYTAPDGSHYIYKVKSETIDAKVDKEKGKSLIDADVADAHYTIEDTEGRTEITTDADNKILGYRDSEGTRHEHKISAKHLELSREAANEVNDAFKSAGIKMENPSDFSKDNHIELPIPRIAAQVRIYAPKLPTTKQDDIEAEIEYNDKDGNYFRKPVILNAQGSSSMAYYVKNMAIDINDGSEIKFGDFPTQDSFHLKKYYIDAFRGQCVVGYWLMEQVYKSRPIGQQYPYEYSYSNDSVTDGLGDLKKDFFNGAKCHPDGFPIVITWVNSKTNEETWMGVYAWNLKKSKEVYQCDKKKAENIILDGTINKDTLFGGVINWSAFEIRNPKKLVDINGDAYDGDNPKELSDVDANSKKVKEYITNLSRLVKALETANNKSTFEKYLNINMFIDYILCSNVIYHLDGFSKNWIWVTYDGTHWCPTLYDADSILGSYWSGTFVVYGSDNFNPEDKYTFGFQTVFAEELKSRYKELRDKGIFDVDNIVNLLQTWLEKVGYDNLKKDLELYNETPSFRKSLVNNNWRIVGWGDGTEKEYNPDKTYSANQYCIYKNTIFQAKNTTQGETPLVGTYSKAPTIGGYFNSVKRVANWLKSKIATLDTYYQYNNN